MEMRWAGFVGNMKLAAKLNQMFPNDHKTTSFVFMLETVTEQRQVCYEQTPLSYVHLLVPIESLAHDNGRALVCAEHGYPKGSPDTDS
jgi:hypothetical protein